MSSVPSNKPRFFISVPPFRRSYSRSTPPGEDVLFQIPGALDKGTTYLLIPTPRDRPGRPARHTRPPLRKRAAIFKATFGRGRPGSSGRACSEWPSAAALAEEPSGTLETGIKRYSFFVQITKEPSTSAPRDTLGAIPMLLPKA